MSSIQQLENFITIVEKKGISAAAKEQSITNAAASKRLKLLEQYLGVRLITRNTRSLSLTEAGQYYYAHQKRILSEIERIDEYVHSMRGTVSGSLKINLPMSYGKLRLNPLILKFIQQYPDVEIHCEYDDAYVDVNNGEYDIVIRVGRLENSELIARHLETIDIALLGSKQYFSKNPMPRHPKDLNSHNCLIYTNIKNKEMWQFLNAEGKEIAVKVKGNFHSNNGETIKQAIIDGVGIGPVPSFFQESSDHEHGVVRVLERYRLPGTDAYALFPSRQYLPEKIRVFSRP